MNTTINNKKADLMRRSRGSHTSLFMEFRSYKKEHDFNVFCFFEGIDDGFYYNSRIRESLESDNFITIVGDGKKNVLKGMELILSKNQYSNVKKMFFIDKDFNKPHESHPDLYETSGYSIENYYITEQAFTSLLNTAFGINKYDRNYKFFIDLYRNRFKEFHSIILEYNVLLKYQVNVYNKTYNDCGFDKNRIKNLIKYSLDKIDIKNGFNEYINEIRTNLNIDKSKLERLTKELLEISPYSSYCGKIELNCYAELLRSICLEYSNGNKTNKLPCLKRKIDLALCNNKNYLDTLSLYADTPKDLKKFIKRHKLKCKNSSK